MRISAIVLLVLLISNNSTAQTYPAYTSLRYPRSIVSVGMGDQGAALHNASDAMQFNPANLVFTDKASLSLFRYPYNVTNLTYPFTVAAASIRLGDGVFAGLEYSNFDIEDLQVATAEYPDGTGESFQMYERSIAAAGAITLGSDWAIGAQLRYAWMPWYFSTNKLGHLLVSVGAAYVPEAMDKRLTVGLSLMNFSTAVGQSQQGFNGIIFSQPMPAQINLAADYGVVQHKYFDVDVALGFTKPLEKMKDESGYQGQSSFASLFTAWNEFPEDVTTHIGLGYAWKPVPLGGGVSYFQEMYTGYFSVGSTKPVKWRNYQILTPGIYTSYFTNGIRAGIEAFGVKASVGYAGRWHNNSTRSWESLPRIYETFQFAVSTDWNACSASGADVHAQDRLNGSIVSGGYATSLRLGRMGGERIYAGEQEYKQPSLWSIESDFYLDENSAIIASLGYARMTKLYAEFPQLYSSVHHWPSETTIESLALESGFRYHPDGAFHPLFVQASVGMIWLNPEPDTYEPRYSITPFTKLTVGCAFPIKGTTFVVMPMAGLKTIFMESFMYRTKVLGYNEVELGVNVGCTL